MSILDAQILKLISDNFVGVEADSIIRYCGKSLRMVIIFRKIRSIFMKRMLMD